MKKSLFISLFCIVLTFTCILCGISGTGLNISLNTQPQIQTQPATTEPTQAEATQPETTQSVTVVPETKEPITIEKNKAQVITLSKGAEKLLTSWKSNDESIVTVDSGGRIDAISEGTAKVTATFSNAKAYEYEVTVVKAEKVKVDRYSTAITANNDVLTNNIYDGSGKNPYSIHVNRKMNCVTVYTYDENGEYTVPIRAMISSCGLNDATILGDFSLYFKNEWLGLLNNVNGHYVSGISGDYLFHSVPYHSKSADTLETEEFNKLGTNASLGCVRLATADAKWIYENCPHYTEIKIFDDNNPGPLGRPEAIKITDLNCKWDPTDDSKENPYYKKKPQIIGAENCTIKKDSKFDPLTSITALDTCSNNITDKLEVVGNVVVSRAGTYKLTYSVTDLLNRTAEKTITVTVK